VIDALEKVSLPDGWEREIIAVDDGSTDDTARLLHEFEVRGRVRALFHPGNSGKGRAVKTGLAAATGDYILIQDADAEYDPADIPRLIAALKESDSVFGSRNLGTNNVPYNAIFFYGGLLVTIWYFGRGSLISRRATNFFRGASSRRFSQVITMISCSMRCI
jgi:glycosyltransferase involved in cell wall biosynthesis